MLLAVLQECECLKKNQWKQKPELFLCPVQSYYETPPAADTFKTNTDYKCIIYLWVLTR